MPPTATTVTLRRRASSTEPSNATQPPPTSPEPTLDNGRLKRIQNTTPVATSASATSRAGALLDTPGSYPFTAAPKPASASVGSDGRDAGISPGACCGNRRTLARAQRATCARLDSER